MENREGIVKDLVEKLQRGELTHKKAKKILKKGDLENWNLGRGRYLVL